MYHLVFLKNPVSFSGKHRNACCYLYFGACELKSFPFIPSQVSFLWMIFALQQCQAESLHKSAPLQGTSSARARSQTSSHLQVGNHD